MPFGASPIWHPSLVLPLQPTLTRFDIIEKYEFRRRVRTLPALSSTNNHSHPLRQKIKIYCPAPSSLLALNTDKRIPNWTYPNHLQSCLDLCKLFILNPSALLTFLAALSTPPPRRRCPHSVSSSLFLSRRRLEPVFLGLLVLERDRV